MRKYQSLFIEAIMLCVVFLLARLPLRDFDIWFHIKAGEVFSSLGYLPHTDMFSHTATGREWIHFEWLFQLFVYWLSLIGLWTIPWIFGACACIQIFFLLRIFALFGWGVLMRVLGGFLFFVLTYEYYTARPHVLAYIFLTIMIYVILARIREGRIYIFFTPIMVLVWTNVHSTGFLSWGMCLAYAASLTMVSFFSKKKEHIARIKELIGMAVILALCTILPPMGIKNYILLWRFFSHREFLGNFIAEWAPTLEGGDFLGVWVYSSLFAFTALSVGVSVWKKRRYHQMWEVAPLVVMAGMGFTAVRNIFPGTLGLVVMIGWAGSHVVWARYRLWLLTFLYVLLIVVGTKYVIEKKRAFASERRYFPVQSTEFAKRYLKGKMFNDYSYGGYVLYHVYPTLQVLIDGRAEVYLCCEMEDYINLAYKKHLPDQAYAEVIDSFMDTYGVSFAMISTQKHNMMRKISRLLQDELGWALIFWDDDSQIFVRPDGKNDEIVKQLSAHAATPYARTLYREGEEEQAWDEYHRIDAFAPSARTSNAIGFLQMKNGQDEQAKQRFMDAIDRDPTFESPYMNLGELEAKQGNLTEAIAQYHIAQNKADDRGLIYIRLGELYKASHDMNRAREIWAMGVRKTIDEDAKQTLRSLISSLENNSP